MATILVVDESADVRLALSTILSLAGHNVIGADGHAAALKLARGALPDAILLNLGVPDLDGLETLKTLKANPRTADIPVVVLMARRGPEDVARAMALGAAGHLAMPWADGEPERVISQVLSDAG